MSTDAPTPKPLRLEGAEALVRKYDMLPPGSTVLCAVSGGGDSMCLLHWLTQREGLTVHAAHFDHQLRGEESQRDAAFVRDWCQSHGIPFHLDSGDVAAEARRLRMGIEETARAMRYTYLYRLSRELGADRVATAHNANDNAETLLIHLLRGSALRGLGGIDPRLHHLVRPFLTTSRADIEAYLAHYDIPHIEDSTNADDGFLRNRVRHQLIPLLEEMNPGFVRRMADTIPRLRGDEEVLENQAKALFRQAETRDGDLVIPTIALTQAPDPIALRCIRLLLEESNEGLGDYTAAHLEAILALCWGDSPSGEVHLPYSLTARREYDKLILTHRPVAVTFQSFTPVRGENPVPGTDWAVLLDCDPWPGLTIRPRQTGDTITLPGGHSRSLKRLFIDRKIPRPARDGFPVAADHDGVIFAAPFGPNLSHPHHSHIQIKEIRERME